MSMIKNLMRTGVATKVMSEARKPKNQEKAKQLFHQAKGKFAGKKGDKDGEGVRGAGQASPDRTTTVAEQDGTPRTP